ncbi:MAG: hypothetical protein Q8926_17425, partial [Bacteroidota bacterium]|nr:hypothetical protein [Bacteroidota bacterium]
MKRAGIFLLAILMFRYGQTQIKGNVFAAADRKVMPSKYYSMLYADQVKDTAGNNKMMASHWQNKGGGLFVWQKEISTEGDYEAAMGYAATRAGTLATLSSGTDDSLRAELVVTSGYYPAKSGWYTFNCEQRQLPGVLHLKKGLQTISLRLITKDKDDETLLYAIALIPVTKKNEIRQDSLL